jgi:hypothetical protein
MKCLEKEIPTTINVERFVTSKFIFLEGEHRSTNSRMSVSLENLVRFQSKNANLVGTSNNDCLDAKGGNDKMEGLEGNDKLNGGDGKDLLSGGNGNDELTGGKGAEKYDKVLMLNPGYL